MNDKLYILLIIPFCCLIGVMAIGTSVFIGELVEDAMFDGELGTVDLKKEFVVGVQTDDEYYEINSVFTPFENVNVTMPFVVSMDGRPVEFNQSYDDIDYAGEFWIVSAPEDVNEFRIYSGGELVEVIDGGWFLNTEDDSIIVDGYSTIHYRNGEFGYYGWYNF